MTTAPHITKETFIKILQEKGLVEVGDLLIFLTIDSFVNQEASATEIAEDCGWSDKVVVNGKIARLGIRILEKYNIQPRVRTNGKKAYWDFFFTGYKEGNFFIYKLKPELKEAIYECEQKKIINREEILNRKKILSNTGRLFLWNPKVWPNWADPKDPLYIKNDIEEIKKTGSVVSKFWSCESHVSIRKGDRVFLVKVATAPKGIFGSGKVVTNSYRSSDWKVGSKLDETLNLEEAASVQNDSSFMCVDIEFDVLLHPNEETILTFDKLKEGHLAKQKWPPRGSGDSIKHGALIELEKLWFEFLITHKRNPFSATEEAKEVSKIYLEGARSKVTQTRYERNAYARAKCLEKRGYFCSVCDFNFEKVYGEMGKNYIHVHHLNPFAMQKGEHRVDPIKDLRPVCPNCHSMLHKKNPPWEIDELKKKMKNPYRQ